MRFNILPFVESDSKGNVTSTWKVQPTGDHGKDCLIGRQYLGLLRASMRREDNPALLGRVVEGQMAAGIWSGIEIGFHAALAEIAMV